MISQLAGKDIKGETLNFGGRESFIAISIGERLSVKNRVSIQILLRKVTMEEAGLTI